MAEKRKPNLRIIRGGRHPLRAPEFSLTPLGRVERQFRRDEEQVNLRYDQGEYSEAKDILVMAKRRIENSGLLFQFGVYVESTIGSVQDGANCGTQNEEGNNKRKFILLKSSATEDETASR